MTREEELMLAIESKVNALATRLGYDLVRADCKNTVCHGGYWPNGGRCMDCGGLGYIFEAKRLPEDDEEFALV